MSAHTSGSGPASQGAASSRPAPAEPHTHSMSAHTSGSGPASQGAASSRPAPAEPHTHSMSAHPSGSGPASHGAPPNFELRLSREPSNMELALFSAMFSGLLEEFGTWFDQNLDPEGHAFRIGSSRWFEIAESAFGESAAQRIARDFDGYSMFDMQRPSWVAWCDQQGWWDRPTRFQCLEGVEQSVEPAFEEESPQPKELQLGSETTQTTRSSVPKLRYSTEGARSRTEQPETTRTLAVVGNYWWQRALEMSGIISMRRITPFFQKSRMFVDGFRTHSSWF